ncbi:hypothetical protein [Campylobacter sp. RM16188]|uniref:hypothetical protein n=1 Tax=Campylobacter sp. RM16188 TaxID=1705725 RepID=UPI0015561B6F|nr:hypothetical protein [Campylobacter sp. RM16188]
MGNDGGITKEYYFREILSNRIVYIPLWQNISALDMTIEEDGEEWFFQGKYEFDRVALDKISSLSGLHKFLYLGGDFIAVFLLGLLCLFVVSQNGFVLNHISLFGIFTAICYILLYGFGYKKIFAFGMFINFLFTIFFIFKTTGIKGLSGSLVLYVALYFLLSVVIPVITTKIGYIKKPKNENGEDRVFWFSPKDRKGILVVAYKEDICSEEAINKMKAKREQQRIQRERRKAQQMKKNSKKDEYNDYYE